MAIMFPVGLVFRPTDEEIIEHYLLKKQIGEELPVNGVIQERDVYSEEVLSEVFRSSETHVYFFTQLKKKHVKGSIHDRTVGKATWRSESVGDICVDEKTVIGKKRVLDYINPGSVGHRDWNMKEFSLDGVLLEIPQTSSDYVVCLLEKKERAIKRDRQSKRNAREALVNQPSGCDTRTNKRMRLPSDAYALPAVIAQQAAPIHGEAGVESMANMVDTDTLATLLPSSSYDLSECTSMPPLMEDKPVDEEGGCTSEIRMLPVEKSHFEYQPSIAAPESLFDDAFMDSIIQLSTTWEGFADDFTEAYADLFLNGN